MSSQQRVFTSSSPGAGSGLGGADPRSSPLSEMETLRVFVTERLTAAVEDILGVFGETVARYREQVERQQRQLDSLRSEEDKWNPEAGRSVSPVQRWRPWETPSHTKSYCVSVSLLHLISGDK